MVGVCAVFFFVIDSSGWMPRDNRCNIAQLVALDFNFERAVGG